MPHTQPTIHKSWLEVLTREFEAPYFAELKRFLTEENAKHTVYPPESQVFAAFNHVPFNQIKVVILGQDPYHGPNQAHGLSFSVPDGVRPPPSLQNIFKELNADLKLPIPQTGNLIPWADQGVLLLNATLTVRANTPGSHQKHGWERFTDAAIRAVSDQREHCVFILWGKYAGAKAALIDGSKHLILTAPHPSPFSAHTGFFGCRHFSQTNDYLVQYGNKPIDWALTGKPIALLTCPSYA
jgi:uracil-DNA glycosylase